MFYFGTDPSVPAQTATPLGLVRAPDSLDDGELAALTDVGEEGPPHDPEAIERVWRAGVHWYAGGSQPAVQVCLRHRGTVVLNRAIGHGRTPIEPVRVGTPYCLYSASKAIAAVAVWMLIERGALALDDRVADLVPGYGAHGKSATTVDHVLTHRAGIPFAIGGTADLPHADDRDYVRSALAGLHALHPPGLMHVYHALTWGPLVREIVETATGRPMRDVVADEITGPLGLRWTNFGVDLADVVEVAPSHVTGPANSPLVDAVFRLSTGGTLAEIIASSNSPEFLTSAVPSSSGVSTAVELSRVAELLLRGGELDGARILSPSTIARARRQRRVLRPDVATSGSPLRWGTGFMLGSNRFGPFGRRAPEAFGHTGLTQIAMWADPERELAAAVLSSGKPLGDVDGGRYRAFIDAIASAFPRRRATGR